MQIIKLLFLFTTTAQCFCPSLEAKAKEYRIPTLYREACYSKIGYFSSSGEIVPFSTLSNTIYDCDHLIEQAVFHIYYDKMRAFYNTLSQTEKLALCESFEAHSESLLQEINGVNNMMACDSRVHRAKNRIIRLENKEVIPAREPMHLNALTIYFNGPVEQAKNHFKKVLPEMQQKMLDEIQEFDPELCIKLKNVNAAQSFLDQLDHRHAKILYNLDLYKDHLESIFGALPYPPTNYLKKFPVRSIANINNDGKWGFEERIIRKRLNRVGITGPKTLPFSIEHLVEKAAQKENAIGSPFLQVERVSLVSRQVINNLKRLKP